MAAVVTIDDIYDKIKIALRTQLSDPRTHMLLNEHPANYIVGFFADSDAVMLMDNNEDNSEKMCDVHKRFLEWTDEPTTLLHFRTLVAGLKKRMLEDLGLRVTGSRVYGLKIRWDAEIPEYDSLPAFVRDKCTLKKDAEMPFKAFVEALRAYEREHPELVPAYERTLKVWRLRKWNIDVQCGVAFNVSM